MIAKPSIAFNDFSGSAKDVTARSSKGRTILSCKSYSGSIITPAQAVSRNSLSKISRAYKQLSESQMKSWESLALHFNSKPSLSYSIKLTAHNAFIRINSNRQMLGQSLLTDAPDYLHNIPTVTYDNILITTKRVLISGIQNTSDDLKLVVKMSAGQIRESHPHGTQPSLSLPASAMTGEALHSQSSTTPKSASCPKRAKRSSSSCAG